MKPRLQSSFTKTTKGISNAIAFAVAITIALSLGCLVLIVK
jgi:hypothetical protein